MLTHQRRDLLAFFRAEYGHESVFPNLRIALQVMLTSGGSW